MKKKNYKCKNCGRKYANINWDSFSKKCLTCKKNNKRNIKCDCPDKNQPHQGLIRRQNTAYQNNNYNYIIACDEEFKRIEEYWGEMWNEYYKIVM